MRANASRSVGVIDRRRQILELLCERGQLSIGDLSSHLSVSQMTVRRDLEALERERALKRVRGAAVSPASRSYEPPYPLRASRHTDAKMRIGQAAAAMVREGETVAIDAGSTALAVAAALAPQRNFTVVTPNLRAVWVLVDNPEIRVIVTGGLVRHGERALNGIFSERAFDDLFCDIFFMGVGGVDHDVGFTEYTLDGTRTKQAALRTSRRRVVVADASSSGSSRS
jgi:DeoR/GlpR family transcriptional regulator of sugar metabolism